MSFFIVISFFFSYLSYPNQAHAGFFDFVTQVFASNDNTESIDPASGIIDSASVNSQNIPLLKPSVSSNSSSSSPSEQNDVSINDDALTPAGVSSLGNTVVDPDSDSSEDGASLYVVNAGDTISSVAKMFDISDATLISTNELKKGQKLLSGQVLVIMPVDGVQVLIKKGDTVQALAKKYTAEIKEITRFNELLDGVPLAVGDSIFIPNGTPAISPALPRSSSAPKISGNKISKTKSGIYASLSSLSGYFINPVLGARRSQGLHDVSKFNGLSGGAVDLAINTGTPIEAAASGTIVASNYTSGRCGSSCFGGFGNFVVIKHSNGTYSLYAHMSKVFGKAGQEVGQGDKIGLVGSTGHSTGPHLHFATFGIQNPGVAGSWANN